MSHFWTSLLKAQDHGRRVLLPSGATDPSSGPDGRLRSEQILRIYPLPVPEPDTVVPVDQLVQIPSVALFVERAQESLLSEREQEVLRLVAEGLTSKVIGQQIFLSPRTVDHHLTSIFSKLGVDTRAQAVAVAARDSLY